MVYLRHPSRVLPPSEAPYPPLLGIVAAQLKVTPAAWSQYAKRDETRREHLQELLDRFELRQFDRSYYRELIDWLMPLALQTTQGMVLAHAVANELRDAPILLPTVALIEKMCAIALTRAERETFRRLTAGLPTPIEPPSMPYCWCVLAAVAAAYPGSGSHREPRAPMRCSRIWRAYGQCWRLTCRRTLVATSIKTACSASRAKAPRPRSFSSRSMSRCAGMRPWWRSSWKRRRRSPTRLWNLHDRLIGTFFSKARSKYDREFAADGQALNDKVRLYAQDRFGVDCRERCAD